ncbi:uncharacterized protein UTRI_06373 [Ustilago trichophora]|uniref:Uncharacterized protein n=1 Tax=Ustilago trichophora TaxID=86804 RepID=A0A5C3EIM7_9BASI|nr:uncharacterized protein UTRI_06373 [Ustilago trichophora]
MFLPRKLQKRARSNSVTQTSQARQKIAAANTSKISSTERDNDIRTETVASSPEDDHEPSAISSQASSTAGQYEAQGTRATLTEAAKVDRLVEFLYLRLSPLWLALHSLEEHHQRGTTPCSDLVAHITSPMEPESEDSPNKERSHEAKRTSTIHLARILNLLPGLPTRCKSISLLSQALQAMQDGPAAGWFTLHAEKFQLEWSSTYSHITHQLRIDIGSRLQNSSLVELMSHRLVYIESIPPRIRTRSHAAAYLVNLINNLTHTLDNAAVLAVLEPSLVDRQLMAEPFSIPSAAVLEDRWISGRGFFLLDSPESVDLLCHTYHWNLADRVAATDAPQNKQEPIRCLDWTHWIEMKQLYLQQQQQQHKPHKSESLPDSSITRHPQCITTNTNKTLANINRKPPSSPTSSSPHLPKDNWFLGTILILDMVHLRSINPNIPFFFTTTTTTTSSNLEWNQLVKSHLEKLVPESISYIHSSLDLQGGSDKIVIRTSHRICAEKLILVFPLLRYMDQGQEQIYWSCLPRKVQTAAYNRMIALDNQLACHAKLP